MNLPAAQAAFTCVRACWPRPGSSSRADPSSSDPTYLKQSNAAIYNAMSAVDPQGIYVMQVGRRHTATITCSGASAARLHTLFPSCCCVCVQGWLFVNSPGFWKPAAVQAYLSGVPNDNMLILDLFTESTPTWNRFDSFYVRAALALC